MRFIGFSNYTEVWEITMKRNTLLQLDEFITGVQTAGKCLVRTLKATRLRYVDHEERNPTPWASWQRVTSSAREPHNGLSQVQCWAKESSCKQTNKAHTKGFHWHKEPAHLMMMKVRRSYFRDIDWERHKRQFGGPGMFSVWSRRWWLAHTKILCKM